MASPYLNATLRPRPTTSYSVTSGDLAWRFAFDPTSSLLIIETSNNVRRREFCCPSTYTWWSYVSPQRMVSPLVTNDRAAAVHEICTRAKARQVQYEPHILFFSFAGEPFCCACAYMCFSFSFCLSCRVSSSPSVRIL